MSGSRGVAVVTGASSGIGLATARTLAEQGFTVVGTSRDTSTAPTVPGVSLLPLDVTSEESVASLVETVVDRHGRIDVLVNNAGIGALGAAEESSTQQAQAVFDVNVFGVLRTTRAVLPHMRHQRRGRIVNVSSILGLVPAPYMAVYAATKHAVEGYSESLDHEVRSFGIRVVLVEPGYTSTGFEASALPADEPLDAYSAQRGVAIDLLQKAMRGADDPQVVADAVARVVAAGTPPVRRPAGRLASQVSLLRRFAPRRGFDRQIRSINGLPRG